MSMQAATHIHIKGAREHNLKNLEVRIPRGALVVVTGPSGSGKSSLAFDTLYAEGYRKYMESLSAQARQVLEQLKKPDVDFVHGLSPVLAIEQRTGDGSPRSTIATVTEIADYARLLWSLVGEQRCPKDGGRVLRRSLDDNLARLYSEVPGQRIMLLAPLLQAKPSVLRDELPRLRQRGFQRVRIGGEIKSLDDSRLIPTGSTEVQVDLVVDRLVVAAEQRSRLADSLELCFREGRDRALVLAQQASDGPWRELTLSQHLACEVCGDVFEKLTPRHFSFNHSEGACTTCGGLGRKLRFVPELVVPDPDKSVREGALKPWRLGGKNLIIKHNAILKQLAEQAPFDADAPWRSLPEPTRQLLLHGSGERLFAFKLRRMREARAMPFEGVIPMLEESWRETDSDGFRARLTTFMVSGPCPECHGQRLNARSCAVKIQGSSLPEFFNLDVSAAAVFIQQLQSGSTEVPALGEVVGGIAQRLHFLSQTGLEYLQLNREYDTLSGGEAQRVRLATQLGMGLMGVIYVLDEPSIGLHPADNERLLNQLRELRDRGNTVVVVEHDEDTLRIADKIIELGPQAGAEGGRILFEGTPEECMRQPIQVSQTGGFLSRRLRVEKNTRTKEAGDAWLTVREARANNLKGIDVRFPIGLLTVVTGVSGSGKSTLVNDTLAAAAARKLNGAKSFPGAHRHVENLDFFNKLVQVDQSPIGRSPRSNPATYTKLLDLLRDLYAQVPLAKVRGYKANRFSFNVRGGRCERCQGDGVIKLDMQFMADAYAPCPSCGGRRFNRETLEVLFHGHSIADVLDMSVREAMQLFRNIPRVMDKLETLAAVGLGYLALGQSATTLSGGEAQRLKLSLELSRRQQGETLYILDEPTTGLHWTDIQNLMDLLFKLRDAGNTIIIIEHNLDVISLADWVVDLGPGGGRKGGELVFAGTVDGLAKQTTSLTGRSLARWRSYDLATPR
ncbi:MAG: excinuclease ABC subunit UvrA [Opitutaceae bacterium]|nr:excinuclease ABC subunit UvrA [Opitutaceae bacterium]